MALVFALLGSVLFTVGVGCGARSLSQSFGTRSANGTVVALERQSGGDGDAYLTVAEYRVAGTRYQAKGSVAFSPPAHNLGQTVRVLYDENQPSKGYINSFFDRWLFAAIFMLIGGTFAIGGYGFLWISRPPPVLAP
jgi:hypothetical protein